jgi:tetratricopeptide (TPR) repeat protein
MAAHPSFGSPSFQLVAKGLVALHRLIKDGKDESAEAESTRDALDAPLKALRRPENERARWLSEDLYSISEPPATVTLKEMNPQAQQQLNEAYEARQNREWDRALSLLRRWQEYISPALVSYLRGAIWLEAGNPDVAAEFYRHASESDPTNANYRAIYFHALSESDPKAASVLAGEVLTDPEKHAPVVVARAADIRLNETRNTPDTTSERVHRELIPVLERNMARLEADESASSRLSAYAMTVGLLGFCHEFLGNAQAAVQYYTRGLRVNPENDGLLVARGILQYGVSPQAVTDLEQAARLGSPVVWPYLFLAHHYLITGRFEQCRVMSETGLRMRGSNTAMSQLEEWRAIAQAELGFPANLVRATFETAVRLDPSNETAQRNQVAFEELLKAPHTIPRTKWEQRTVSAVRQFGLAERRYALAA